MPTSTAASSPRQSWEEARWPTLSPAFREAHNRLRSARGQQPIPPPKIDLYVPPRGPVVTPFDPSDKEFIAEVRKFHGGAIPGAWAQGEGFSINGKDVSFGLSDQERKIEQVVRAKQRVVADSGFKINGRAVG